MEGETPTKQVELTGPAVTVQSDGQPPPYQPPANQPPPSSSHGEDDEPTGAAAKAMHGVAVWITEYPLPVCGICWVIIIVALILSAQGFDIAQQASREFIVEDDEYVIRQDALRLAGEAADAAAAASVTETPNSQRSGLFSWTLYFRGAKNTDFLLTRSTLATIKKYEDKIVKDAKYATFCWAPASVVGDYTCQGQGGSLAYRLMSDPGYATMTDADIRTWVRNQGPSAWASLNAEYPTTGKVWFYRSFIFMGAPVPGAIVNSSYRETQFQNSFIDSTKQQTEYNKYAVPIWVDVTTSHQGKLEENGMQIVAFSVSPLINEFGTLLIQSSLFALGSMLFVLCYLWFHLQSFWMACSGMFQILMAFPTAFVLYHYVYGIKYFGFLSYLIIFVLLGLGADDIFVLVDAFHQSEHIVKDPTDLKQRMSYSYRRAAKAMLVTQATTFFAFLATAASVLMPISAFGFWAATLVACNYFLVITFYVASLVMWQRWIKHQERFGCCCKFCCPPECCCTNGCCWDGCCCEPKRGGGGGAMAVGSATNTDGGRPPAALTRQKSVEDIMGDYRCMEKFFGSTWVSFINRFKIFILVFFVVLYILGAIGAAQLQPQTEDEQFFPEDHYFNFLFFVWPNEFYQGENDGRLTVTWYWGIQGVDRTGNDRFDTDNYGTVIYDSSFDMSSPGAQHFMDFACGELQNNPLMFQSVNASQRVTCFTRDVPGQNQPLGFKTFLSTKNLSFPFVATVAANQKNEFNRLVYDYMNTQGFGLGTGTPAVDARRSGNTYTVNYVRYSCKTNLGFFNSPAVVKDFLGKWEALKIRVSQQCTSWNNATGVCNPNFLDDNGQFTRLATGDAFVSSATTGIAIALPLAFVILILSTHNIVISFISVMDIGGVVMCELAIMALLQWQLGIAESVALIMMIGFSVDYVVHLGHAYVECPYPGRLQRLQYAMLTMGISVVSGGITTFGAGIFLSFPIFIFFRKIGLLLMTTIVNSLIWALFFFTSMLALWGPEGSFGRVPLEKVFFCCPEACADHMTDAGESAKGRPVAAQSEDYGGATTDGARTI